MAVATDYKGLKVIAPPGCDPLEGSKMIHGLSNQKRWRNTGQILDPNFFRRFPLTPVEFGHKPKPLVSLWNYLSIHMWIIENRVRMRHGHPFLMQTGPKGRGRLEVELDWAFRLCCTTLLVFCTSTTSSKFFMTLFSVPKQDNIIR